MPSVGSGAAQPAPVHGQAGVFAVPQFETVHAAPTQTQLGDPAMQLVIPAVLGALLAPPISPVSSAVAGSGGVELELPVPGVALTKLALLGSSATLL